MAQVLQPWHAQNYLGALVFQEKVSRFIGKSRSHISNSLRLLSLPEKLIDMIRYVKISQGHAKILIGLENSLILA